MFAAAMAEKWDADWQVVNLTRALPAGEYRTRVDAEYGDPTTSVRAWLAPEHRRRFTYRTWEGLHRDLVSNNRECEGLATYMEGKSAHFKRAFQLDRSHV